MAVLQSLGTQLVSSDLQKIKLIGVASSVLRSVLNLLFSRDRVACHVDLMYGLTVTTKTTAR